MPALSGRRRRTTRSTCRPAWSIARGGQAAYDALVTAAGLRWRGEINGSDHRARCTRRRPHGGPCLSRPYRLLAELCGVNDFAMMLYLGPGGSALAPGLAIVHVTLHMALRTALDGVTTRRVLAKIRLVDEVMRRLTGSPAADRCLRQSPRRRRRPVWRRRGADHSARGGTGPQRRASASRPLPADTLIARALPAISTRWWPCITIRDTSPSSCWPCTGR